MLIVVHSYPVHASTPPSHNIVHLINGFIGVICVWGQAIDIPRPPQTTCENTCVIGKLMRKNRHESQCVRAGFVIDTRFLRKTTAQSCTIPIRVCVCFLHLMAKVFGVGDFHTCPGHTTVEHLAIIVWHTVTESVSHTRRASAHCQATF